MPNNSGMKITHVIDYSIHPHGNYLPNLRMSERNFNTKKHNENATIKYTVYLIDNAAGKQRRLTFPMEVKV